VPGRTRDTHRVEEEIRTEMEELAKENERSRSHAPLAFVSPFYNEPFHPARRRKTIFIPFLYKSQTQRPGFLFKRLIANFKAVSGERL
jgi:hypothetical protein